MGSGVMCFRVEHRSQVCTSHLHIFGFNANALAQGLSLRVGTSHVPLLPASTPLCFVAIPITNGPHVPSL